MVFRGGVFFEKSNIMKPISKLELVMVAIALIVCGTGYCIWRLQTSEDNLIPSASVLRIEKEQRAKKPVETLPEKQDGFDVKGRIKVSMDNE